MASVITSRDPARMFAAPQVRLSRREDGAILLSSPQPLQAYPRCVGVDLEHWADHAPQRLFLAERGADGTWRELRYGQARQQVRRIAASLVGPEDVAICISHTGRSQEVLEAADMARQQGAAVIGLTAPHTPLSRKADILLELSVFEEIDIYTPSISHFAYHYVIGLITFHIGQSADLDRDGLLAKIKAGLASGQTGDPRQ